MTDEPVQPDGPVVPDKPDKPFVPEKAKDKPHWRNATVTDEVGEEWHAENRRRWAEAVDGAQSPEEALGRFDPVPLPDWSASAPAHVTRELFGRFLQDRDTGIVHDIYAATPDCLVDSIRNGTFFHFWSEVLEDESVATDVPCPLCIP